MLNDSCEKYVVDLEKLPQLTLLRTLLMLARFVTVSGPRRLTVSEWSSRMAIASVSNKYKSLEAYLNKRKETRLRSGECIEEQENSQTAESDASTDQRYFSNANKR